MEKLFIDGIMAETSRRDLTDQSEWFIRDMLRRFRRGQEDGVPASDVERAGNEIASLIAQFLWQHQ